MLWRGGRHINTDSYSFLPKVPTDIVIMAERKCRNSKPVKGPADRESGPSDPALQPLLMNQNAVTGSEVISEFPAHQVSEWLLTDSSCPASFVVSLPKACS